MRVLFAVAAVLSAAGVSLSAPAGDCLKEDASVHRHVVAAGPAIDVLASGSEAPSPAGNDTNPCDEAICPMHNLVVIAAPDGKRRPAVARSWLAPAGERLCGRESCAIFRPPILSA